MIRRRSDEQVLAAAAQMDAALAVIEPAVLTELAAARATWRDTGAVPALSVAALAALGTPAAREWDAVFVRAARRG